MIRRSVLIAASLVLAATGLAACSTGATDSADGSAESASKADKGAFPVTVEHAYGSTEITEEPTNVATIGWSDHDVALSLGVVPVAAQAITWGGNEQQSTDWFDAELKKVGGKQPVRYNADTSIPFTEISKAAPDLILATNSGITEADYKKLSEIAPTVAFPGAPWLTSWQDSLEMIGKATGRVTLSEEVKKETEDAIAQAQKDHPQIVGASYLVTGVQDNSKLGTIGLYGAGDARPQMLTQLGMELAPVADKLVPKGQFYTDVSAEKAPELESEVLINLGYTAGSFEALQKDKLLSQIPAIKNGHYLDVTDQPLSLTFSAASTLSIPYFIDELVPSIAEAVDGGKVNVTAAE